MIIKKIVKNLVNFSKYVNYKNIRNAAWIFLINNNVSCLPINVWEIANQNNWIIITNKEIQLINALEKSNKNNNCDGFTCIIDNYVFIILKECNNLGRLRFTIAHEFGHIVLLHLEKVKGKELEKEANMFAARILMPLCVLKECHSVSPEAISKLCGTSITASIYRANRLKDVLQRDMFYVSAYEKKLIKQFDEFIKRNKKYEK